MKQNCWEIKKCGREEGGSKVNECGVCPAFTSQEANGTNYGKNGGRVCWAVSGTFCAGKKHGTFAQKQLSCMSCDVYNKVALEEGDNFSLLIPGQQFMPKQ